LNGKSDSSLSTHRLKMSAAGLQEQAEALLKTLAIESHEKELQHLAHRGVASFDRSGMNEQHRRSYGRQVAKLATDTP